MHRQTIFAALFAAGMCFASTPVAAAITCDRYDTREQAQQAFENNPTLYAALDADKNGQACDERAQIDRPAPRTSFRLFPNPGSTATDISPDDTKVETMPSEEMPDDGTDGTMEPPQEKGDQPQAGRPVDPDSYEGRASRKPGYNGTGVAPRHAPPPAPKPKAPAMKETDAWIAHCVSKMSNDPMVRYTLLPESVDFDGFCTCLADRTPRIGAERALVSCKIVARPDPVATDPTR